MFGLGMPELLLILGVIVLLFVVGPKQLPKLGKMFGKTMKEVRKGMQDMTSEMDDDESAKPAAKSDDDGTQA